MDTSLNSGWRQTQLASIFYPGQLKYIKLIGLYLLGDLHDIGVEGLQLLGLPAEDIQSIKEACKINAKHILPEHCVDEMRDELSTRPRLKIPQPQKKMPLGKPPIKPLMPKSRPGVWPQPPMLSRTKPTDDSNTSLPADRQRISKLELDPKITGMIERSGFEFISDLTHCTAAEFRRITKFDDDETNLVAEALIKLGLYFRVIPKPNPATNP